MESREKYRLDQGHGRTRVLFVPQWYPSPDVPGSVTGTFCREHVRAAALFDDVAVLVLTRRKDRVPTLRWQRMNDCGIPTYYASYGSLPVPKTGLPLFYVNLWRAVKRSLRDWGRPHVIHTQDSYAYYVMRAAQNLNVPFVISQHWTGFMERKLDDKTLRQFQWAFGRAKRVLAANQFAAADYEHYGLRASIQWLPNALDTKIFYPSQNPERKPWLLHASGFTPAKRFPDIVEAFHEALAVQPEAVLQVVGEGPNRPEMARLAARRLPLASFRFHGSLTKPEIAELMRSARGFVLASDAETFGCVLMEAMACGCPVLTTSVGGIRAVVRNGEGLFAEVGNIDQIARGMVRLLDGSHGLDRVRIAAETQARFNHSRVGGILHNEHVRAVRMNGDYSAA